MPKNHVYAKDCCSSLQWLSCRNRIRKYQHKNQNMESSTWAKWSKGWLGEGGLRWWGFYISKTICTSEGHLSYFIGVVLQISLLLCRCIYLYRITNILAKKRQQWSVSCCTVEVRVMMFIKWPADTHSFLCYAKREGMTLVTLIAAWQTSFSLQISPIYPNSPGRGLMLALAIRYVTDITGHNSPETSEIAPAF